MHGSCKCNNIVVQWQTVDYTVVPRRCRCEYCKTKNAAYVSKSGSRFSMEIHKDSFYRVMTHGSLLAKFHECLNCAELVCVTADIDGEIYGALNSNCMQNKLGFPRAIEFDFSNQSAEEKVERWRRNWCHPVLIKNSGAGL